MYQPETNRWLNILIDDLPGFDIPAAEAIAEYLSANGYHVQRCTAQELVDLTSRRFQGSIRLRGAMTIIPNCESLPIETAEYIQQRINQGARYVFLGGPLFYNNVQKVDGKWQAVPQPDSQLDPSFSKDMPARLVIEGVTPSYKTFPVYGAEKFVTDPEQFAYDGAFQPGEALDIICPIARMHGIGFDNKRRWRYIPVVHAVGEGGRNHGKRGALAFFMLHETDSFFFGGIAALGIKRQDIMNITGAPELLLSLINRLMQGVFLYEGGANQFCAFPGEDLTLGARVLNASGSYVDTQVIVTVVNDEGEPVLKRDLTAMAGPSSVTSCRCAFSDIDPRHNYNIDVELFMDGVKLDQIHQELPILLNKPARPEEFVTVNGDNFMLENKPWYPVGVNFWPLYVGGLEFRDYWIGWLDRRYYDPVELEYDLEMMEEMGMSAVSIQLGIHPFEMGMNCLLDFLYRADRHGIKTSISFANATSPINFSLPALRELVHQSRIAENPAVFAYDIMWEPGNYMFNEEGRKTWDPFWEKWLIERYGSIERAEQDFGMPVNRDEEGNVVSPPTIEFEQDGPWRIRMAAYRRFMDDLMSRLWRDACQRIRLADPKHLISFRQGNTLPHDFALTATNKHIDFICPEGYSIQDNPEGYNAACFITRFVDHTTAGKPCIWFEFGISVNGVEWETLYMDRDRQLPPEYKIEAQGSYHSMYYRMVEETLINGTFPWWWPGGYRCDEKSDFGIVNPDGTLRPAGELVVQYAPIIRKPRKRPEPDEWVTLDRDSNSGGYWYLSFNDGRIAYQQAHERGHWLGIRTAGSGTTSADTPLIAIGNVPFDGTNPPKYLNGEFETIQILNAEGKWQTLDENDVIDVPAGKDVQARIVAGNLREATWLAPASVEGDGGVYIVSTADSDLTVRMPIENDAAYLKDANASGVLCAAPEAPAVVEIHLEAEGRACFGEKRSFTLNPV